MSTSSNPANDRPAEQEQRRRELSQELWAMSPAQRQAAMWHGELSSEQLWEWAKRAPSEVPLINGEFPFIVARTPEVAELEERSR